MKKNNADITILTIGDKIDWETYQMIDSAKALFKDQGFCYVTGNYENFLNGKSPPIKTEKIIIFLCFPYVYWDSNIEHKTYRGVYGNRTFHKKFVGFWDVFARRIQKTYSGKQILFINDPRMSAAYRDKLIVNKLLAKSNILTPKLYSRSGVKGIQNILARGTNLYLKPQFGTMGKGITFISPHNWQTNFIFNNNRIISLKSDHGWKFSDVTENHDFLKQLLKKDIIIQEGIGPHIVKGHLVDFRIYTFFNKVMYIYPRKNTEDHVTTNISQGGCGDRRLLKVLPKSLVDRIKTTASKVSEVLDIKLAGIDIVFDKRRKEAFVIDVNCFSGFPRKKTFDLARHFPKELGRLNRAGKLNFF